MRLIHWVGRRGNISARVQSDYGEFVWHNRWLAVELDSMNGNAVIRRYAWWLDLSGALEAADDPGPYASRNAFRLSTKSFNDETHFGYWGYH